MFVIFPLLPVSIVNKVVLLWPTVPIWGTRVRYCCWVYGVRMPSKLLYPKPNPRLLLGKFFGENIPAWRGTGLKEPDPVTVVFICRFALFLLPEFYLDWLPVAPANLLPWFTLRKLPYVDAANFAFLVASGTIP